MASTPGLDTKFLALAQPLASAWRPKFCHAIGFVTLAFALRLELAPTRPQLGLEMRFLALTSASVLKAEAVARMLRLRTRYVSEAEVEANVLLVIMKLVQLHTRQCKTQTSQTNRPTHLILNS